MVANLDNSLDTYKRWNDALAAYFFNTTRQKQRCFLAVDENALTRIGEILGITDDPVESFIEAVRNLCPPETLFESMYSYGIRWRHRRTQDPPMFVGGLGIAVLAATRMGHDPSQGIASHNYYTHLNTLLGLPQASGKPSGFHHSPKLWELLAEWLNGAWGGRLGLPTAMQMGRPYIGWPISQALVRRADMREFRSLRQRLREYDLEEITAEDVLPFLKVWLLEEGVTSRLTRLLGPRPTPAVLMTVAECLSGVLSEWEVEEQEAGRGESMAQLHLGVNGFNYKTVTVQLAWRCPPNVEDEVRINLPDGSVLEQRVRGEWIGITPEQKWFHGSCRLECNGSTVTSAASPPLVFVKGDGYGRPGWWVANQREIPLGEPCRIVSPPWQFASIHLALSDAQPGWQYHERCVGLPDGWILFSGVTFTKPPQGVFAAYRTRVFKPWGFQGGVRIHHQTWLHGALPKLEAEPDVLFEIMDIENRLVDTVPGGTDLNGLQLQPGAYTIQGEGIRSRRFVAMAPTWPLPQPDMIKNLDYLLKDVQKAVRVTGALVNAPSGLSSPTFLPANLPPVVIGPCIGDVGRIEGPAVAGLVAWTEPFVPAWALRTKGDKVIEVIPLLSDPPLPVPESGGNRTNRQRWAAMIIGGRNRLRTLTPAQREVYGQYIKLARRVD